MLKRVLAFAAAEAAQEDFHAPIAPKCRGVAQHRLKKPGSPRCVQSTVIGAQDDQDPLRML